ncbi:AbrB/MazE/SpoVT family DNA-binding domain-containing protein [Companilactobacillus ginsenosidimutans]|uniref:SpoVT-AbrB domain-containing protein n=1 Tax=Companilactobacillus ginsenosidimutans TaxID=1007676 RepID=A0A0H4R240_9LACO|nr:AbrB/MazE/SpoVT family DNA-binding domain-containing protein [Companilactobacillus ginsenosidimutans]AKP67805.1 hypothetical protein ABM34_09860 [Companilactobacillus ginsenosidimutans]
MERKLIKVGDSIAVTIPKPFLNQLSLQAGDIVSLDEKNEQIHIEKKEPSRTEDEQFLLDIRKLMDENKVALDALEKYDQEN